MAHYESPRKGSMAFYPRVRAKKETPTMRAWGKDAKALSFLCYKVGMTQVLGKNKHKGSPTFGAEIVVPATIIECPPIKVLGIRAYQKNDIGVSALSDVLANDFEKEINRKIVGFKDQSEKNKKESAEKGNDKYTIEDFEKEIADIEYFTLLVYTQPKKIDLKKTPEIVEANIGGNKEEQLKYAKSMLGKEINFNDLFAEGDFLDIKAVTKGKGFQGVINRFGIKQQRPKSKKRRIVGSISPWHPHTVMFTVARAGQMGYHNRTEYNKKVIKISDNVSEVNNKSGFTGYGHVSGKYALIYGSIPGVAKRCISVRKSIRPEKKAGIQLERVERILVK